MGGYCIPENLKDNKDIFVFSFANRTKKNLEYIEQIAEKERFVGINVKNASVFEVTQLINSMIGLVTFPKEAFWDKIDKAHGNYASPEINKLVDNILTDKTGYEYRNTYLVKCRGKQTFSDGHKYKAYECTPFEHLDALSLIRHMRNALSHENLSVYPYPVNADDQIEGFMFSDNNTVYVQKYNDMFFEVEHAHERTQEFKLKLNVQEIRTLSFAICDMLLAVIV